MFAESKRQRLNKLCAQLENERSSFIPQWRDAGELTFPRRLRLTTDDTNRGDRRNSRIIDSTGTQAARTLRSGMMSGVTSPARPWFRLTTPDPDLAEFQRVKVYLHDVSQRLGATFLKSNLYQTLPTIYGDMGVFGTGAMMIEEDFEKVLRFRSFAIGGYGIATDFRRKVNVWFRDFAPTVRQIVEQFGKLNDGSGRIDWRNISHSVKQAWEEGQYETRFQVRHVIAPNDSYNPRMLLAKFKKYSSCYFELGSTGSAEHNGSQDVYLRESGYDYFPLLVPRWEVTDEDSWGTSCPGMDALGDLNQLQLQERRVAEAIEKKVRPPMTAPTSLKGQHHSILPADVTYVDVRQGQQGFQPAHEVNLSISELEQKQEQIRNRIRRCFYEDLFLMLANDTRSNITAREIEERHEEKLLMLGPVLEQLNQDLLDPLIDISFDIMNRQGLLPEPPEELQGIELKVEYISVMAQAQKLVGIGAHDRFLDTVSRVAAVDPTALKKFNSKQFIDVIGDSLSVQPSVIRSDDEVAEMEAAEAQAAKAQQQAEVARQSAAAFKDLSQTSLEGDSALTAMMQGEGEA